MGIPGSKPGRGSNKKTACDDTENDAQPIVSTKEVAKPASRNDGSLFNLWKLPEEVSHSILVEYLREPRAVFADYRRVSKLWHYNLDSEKLWKSMCLFNKCWLPYETEPTNWNRLFLLIYGQLGAYHLCLSAAAPKGTKARKAATQDARSRFFYPFTEMKQQPNSNGRFVFHPPSGQIFSVHLYNDLTWTESTAHSASMLATRNNKGRFNEFSCDPTTRQLMRNTTDLGYFIAWNASKDVLHMEFIRTVAEGKTIAVMAKHWNYREKLSAAAYLWTLCRHRTSLDLCDVTYAKTNELILASPTPLLLPPNSKHTRLSSTSGTPVSDGSQYTGTGTYEDSPQYTGTDEATDSWEALKPLRSPLGIAHILQILEIDDSHLVRLKTNENTLQLTLRLVQRKEACTCLEDYLKLSVIQQILDTVKNVLPQDMPEDLAAMFLEFCLAKEIRDKKVQDELQNCAFLKLGEGAEKLFKDSLKEHGYDKVTLGPFTHQLRFSVDHPKEERFDLDYISIDSANKFLAENCGGDNGFRLIENFLSASEMDALMSEIDEGNWRPDLEAKQVQVFGYNYLKPSATPCEIPSYFDQLRKRLEENAFGCYDQLIISDYPAGVGLKPHVDRFYWDEKIIGISLVSGCTLVLKDLQSRQSTTHYLPPGSLYQLQGLSRYTYTHAIEAESVIDRRVSLTFRNLATKSVDFPAEIAQKLKIRPGYSQKMMY